MGTLESIVSESIPAAIAFISKLFPSFNFFLSGAPFLPGVM